MVGVPVGVVPSVGVLELGEEILTAVVDRVGPEVVKIGAGRRAHIYVPGFSGTGRSFTLDEK